MILKQKVEAGVMLYALFMAAIFCLLLQFYLHRHTAVHQHYQAAQEECRAYLMAELVLEEVCQETERSAESSDTSAPSSVQSGQVSFTSGEARYQIEDDQVTIMVEVVTGKTYAYTFSTSSVND